MAVSLLLVPLCLYAIAAGRSWGFVVKSVLAHDVQILGNVCTELSLARAPEFQLAASALESYCFIQDRQRQGYLAAAIGLLDHLMAPDMLDCTADSGLNVDAFLTGEHAPNNFFWTSPINESTQPLYGRFDTIYTIADTMTGKFPFLAQLFAFTIRRRRFELAAMSFKGPILLWMNDELISAPDPHISDIVQARALGVNIHSAVQDESLAATVYGRDEATALISANGIRILRPGLVDVQILEAVSKIIGDFDRLVLSQSENTQGNGPEWSQQMRYERTSLLPPSKISGGIPGLSDAALMIMGDGSWEWRNCTPYWRGPWLPMWVDSLAHAVESDLRGPLPPLDMSGTAALKHYDCLDLWEAVKQQHAEKGLGE